VISFVWPKERFVGWAGGSEVYTLSQIAELRRRGIAARLVVCGEAAESVMCSSEVPILTLRDKNELMQLDDTLVFIMRPIAGLGPLKHPAYVILHVPVSGHDYDDSQFYANGLSGYRPIVTSRFMADHWQSVLGLSAPPPVMYPSADTVFSEVVRPERTPTTRRALFAGRAAVTKGIYVLFAAMQTLPLCDEDYTMACVKHSDRGTINALIEAHPRVQAIPAQTGRHDMAALYASHDVVVMPSLWQEPFGMIAIEAQHAGCRVVASDIGGLSETDCGGLILVEPNNPCALAEAMTEALRLGPLTLNERQAAAQRFTAAESVDSLLKITGLNH
jgi:D-inositol-3-phosphate glycosyltransferase